MAKYSITTTIDAEPLEEFRGRATMTNPARTSSSRGAQPREEILIMSGSVKAFELAKVPGSKGTYRLTRTDQTISVPGMKEFTDSKYECTCPDFIYRHSEDRTLCKHLRDHLARTIR